MPDKPVFYTVDEVAAILGVSAKTVRRRIADGSIEHVRLGKFMRVTGEQLQRLATTSSVYSPQVSQTTGPRLVRIVPKRDRVMTKT